MFDFETNFRFRKHFFRIWKHFSLKITRNHTEFSEFAGHGINGIRRKTALVCFDDGGNYHTNCDSCVKKATAV